MMFPRLAAVAASLLLIGQAVVRGQPEAAPPPRGLDQHLDPLPAGTLARMGSVRWRLDAPGVACARFSPDGQRLLVASTAGLAQVWDLASGRELRRLGSLQRRGTTFPGSSALASPDGRLLTIHGAVEKVFRVWDVESGHELWKVESTDKAGLFRGLAFTADGRTLIAEAPPGGIWSIRQAETGQELCQLSLNVKDRGYNPVFAPDGHSFVTTNQDGVIRIWETRTGKKLGQLGKPVDSKTTASSSQPPVFSADSRQLAVVSTNAQKQVMSVTVWNIPTGQEVITTKLAQGAIYQPSISFSTDLRYLAYAEQNQTVVLHELATGKQLHKLGDPQPPRNYGMRSLFSPDGMTLAASGIHNEHGYVEIRAWDVASGRELWRREGSTSTRAFSPNSAVLAALAPLSGAARVQLWDARTGKALNTNHGHRNLIHQLALSRDQMTLTTHSVEGMRQWELASGKELRSYEPPERSRPYPRTIAPDGRAAAFMSEKNGMPAIQLWDLAGHKAISQIELPQPGLLGLAFAPNGRTLAVRGGDRFARLWDVASGKERAVLAEQFHLPPGAIDGNVYPKPGFVFSADGATVATTWNMTFQANPTAADRRDVVYVSRTQNGRVVGRIDPGRASIVWRVAFSPAGRIIAGIVSQPGVAGKQLPLVFSIVLWEASTGKERHRFATDQADSLAFAPDGRSLAVGRRDGTIHFHDVTGREIAKLAGHLSGVTSLLFSPDGRQLISGSSDTTALVWDLTSIRFSDPPSPVKLTEQQLRTAWSDLASSDAAKAFQAIQRLGASPEALPLLQTELKPVPLVDRQKLDRLVADLENNDFQVRERAEQELERIGELALPALEAALAAKPTLEARRRLEQIRDRATGLAMTDEEVRNLRALEALVLIGTTDAKSVLEKLAGGAAGARQTREAQAALDWLRARTAPMQ